MKSILFLSLVLYCVAAKASNADTTAPATIRLHCVSTLSSNNQPLYIINGKAIDDSLATNLMKMLDVKLIERIEVLKDAKAIAQYGSRAFYGVIVISTKQADFKQQIICKPPSYGNDSYIL